MSSAPSLWKYSKNKMAEGIQTSAQTGQLFNVTSRLIALYLSGRVLSGVPVVARAVESYLKLLVFCHSAAPPPPPIRQWTKLSSVGCCNLDQRCTQQEDKGRQ